LAFPVAVARVHAQQFLDAMFVGLPELVGQFFFVLVVRPNPLIGRPEALGK
jgi:hypothetical protein